MLGRKDKAQRHEDARWNEWLRHHGDQVTSVNGDDEWNAAVGDSAKDAVRASRKGRR